LWNDKFRATAEFALATLQSTAPRPGRRLTANWMAPGMNFADKNQKQDCKIAIPGGSK
jgi:hypothetical protein